MNLLDQGVKMAAEANERVEMNYVRKHARSQAKEMGLTVRQAATRIFSNAYSSICYLGYSGVVYRARVYCQKIS